MSRSGESESTIRREAWQQVCEQARAARFSSSQLMLLGLPSEWKEAACMDKWQIAYRLALQMEAVSLLGMLEDPPYSYDAAEVYYRLASLSRLVHMPMRTELARIHEALRQVSGSSGDFSDDLFSRPKAARLSAREDDEPAYRRIRRPEDVPAA